MSRRSDVRSIRRVLSVLGPYRTCTSYAPAFELGGASDKARVCFHRFKLWIICYNVVGFSLF